MIGYDPNGSYELAINKLVNLFSTNTSLLNKGAPPVVRPFIDFYIKGSPLFYSINEGLNTIYIVLKSDEQLLSCIKKHEYSNVFTDSRGVEHARANGYNIVFISSELFDTTEKEVRVSMFEDLFKYFIFSYIDSDKLIDSGYVFTGSHFQHIRNLIMSSFAMICVSKINNILAIPDELLEAMGIAIDNLKSTTIDGIVKMNRNNLMKYNSILDDAYNKARKMNIPVVDYLLRDFAILNYIDEIEFEDEYK